MEVQQAVAAWARKTPPSWVTTFVCAGWTRRNEGHFKSLLKLHSIEPQRNIRTIVLGNLPHRKKITQFG